MGTVHKFRYPRYDDSWHDRYLEDKYRRPRRQRREAIAVTLTGFACYGMLVAWIYYPTQWWLSVAAAITAIIALVFAHRHDMAR